MTMQEQCAQGILYQNGEHKHIWGKTELMETLKQLGFYNIKLQEYQRSMLPDFNNIDTPGEVRSFHSAVVEAMKPW